MYLFFYLYVVGQIRSSSSKTLWVTSCSCCTCFFFWVYIIFCMFSLGFANPKSLDLDLTDPIHICFELSKDRLNDPGWWNRGFRNPDSTFWTTWAQTSASLCERFNFSAVRPGDVQCSGLSVPVQYRLYICLKRGERFKPKGKWGISLFVTFPFAPTACAHDIRPCSQTFICKGGESIQQDYIFSVS